MLAGVGSNKQIEVWTKPLGDGRTAALIVNTAKVNMATGAPTEPAVSRAQAGSGRGGPIMMSACDPKSDSQVWSLSANPNATWSNGKVTNVKGLASNACWEITGCNEKPGAGIGTGYGCKGLPKSGCANPCGCNGAWQLQSNGTIVSFMDGACLTNTGGHLSTDPCDSSNKGQIFKAVPHKNASFSAVGRASGKPPQSAGFSVQNGGKCVDDQARPAPAPTPVPPCVPPACTPGGPGRVTLKLADLKLGIKGPVKVRSLWDKKDLPNALATIDVSVPHHGCTFLVFMPLGSKWPLPFELPAWMKKKPPPVQT